jgi:hypothetical protein
MLSICKFSLAEFDLEVRFMRFGARSLSSGDRSYLMDIIDSVKQSAVAGTNRMKNTQMYFEVCHCDGVVLSPGENEKNCMLKIPCLKLAT